MKQKVLREVRGRGKTRRTKLTGAKLNEHERKQVTASARLFAGGSIAKWARISMLNYKPNPEDFE